MALKNESQYLTSGLVHGWPILISWLGLFFSLCVCSYMCSYTSVHMHLYVEVRGQPWVSPQKNLLPPLWQGFSLAWDLPIGLAWQLVSPQDVSVSTPQHWATRVSNHGSSYFYVGSRGSNSGPCACLVNHEASLFTSVSSSRKWG